MPIGSPLYRAVSPAEMADIIAIGRFRCHPAGRSREGKWFAERLGAAVLFGRRLIYAIEGQPFHVVQVVVRRELTERMFRVANLDGAGPCCYADTVMLDTIAAEHAIISEVTAIPIDAL